MTKDTKKIVGIYLISILVYGVFVSFITSTVHIGCDEELYLELAKSFHYSGKFRFNGAPATYNSVLYSVLLSLTYFFYSPERILFIMRMLGVVTMCSAIFPTWKLAYKVLANKKYAMFFSAISIMLPYMFECGYLMQEVVSFPLFMWTVYFLYCAYDDAWKNMRWVILSSVFSMLCFFTKTHLFFIPVIVNILFFWEFCLKERKWKAFGKLLAYDVVYLFLTGILYFAILYVNRFEQGSNRYVDQFSHLLPITAMTVICAMTLSVSYAALSILCTGIMPMASVISNRKMFKGSDRYLWNFTLASCVFMVFETVLLSTIPEEGLQIFPHRFLFRYIHMLTPLVLLLAVKVWEETNILFGKKIWILVMAVVIVCICYFAVMQGKTTQGIVDGFVFLLLENMAKYFVPYGDVAVAMAAGSVVTGLIWAEYKKNIKKVVMGGGIAIIVALWLVNCVQLPVYNNVIAGGKVIQSDSIQIANYLNKEGVDFVYYIEPENGERYPRNFYGYIKQEWQAIDKSQIEGIVTENGKAVFLVLKDEDVPLDEIFIVDLKIEKLKLFVLK